jgi:hypothetical protein
VLEQTKVRGADVIGNTHLLQDFIYIFVRPLYLHICTYIIAIILYFMIVTKSVSIAYFEKVENINISVLKPILCELKFC